MFDKMNYAELEEWRSKLLMECVGLPYGNPKFEENQKWIGEIDKELHRREDIAFDRFRKVAIGTLNVLVLGLILLVSGCETAKGGLQFGGGVMKDLGWLMQETANNIQTEGK